MTRLESLWDPAAGTLALTLRGATPDGARLALTSICQLSPAATQLASYHEFDLPLPGALSPGHRPRHANDGPVSAFLILPDDTTVPVDVAPMRTTAEPGTPGATRPSLPEPVFEGAPRYPFRGLHVDLARQWFEPDVVLRLLDACAARRLNRLHLHLTDDEAWRLPVAAYPELGEIGGTRGHGLPLGPMLGGGPEPVGRAYTPGEIGEWVRRADALGVVLVPEVDLPAHSHAALTAVPKLRDPADTSGATSVQFFTDNVVVPGLPATRAFLEAVVDAMADLFPSSPHLHIGGDEVPSGAWGGSPTVARLRAEHGLATARDVEAHFHRELVDLIRTRTGRQVGAWQEAAESGGVRPEDGYVVGWRSAADCRALAAAGYDVVLAPAEAYYLDMAVDDGWDTPGASWAGSTSLADVQEFVPGAGWSDEERDRMIGVQACLWTEHVHDEAALWDRLLPRLDAIAGRAWSG